ncbi:MAG: hypothetical protein V9G29_14660 [Burkholderiaceae bacterium]
MSHTSPTPPSCTAPSVADMQHGIEDHLLQDRRRRCRRGDTQPS